ncbi:MAG: hypothetical protein WCO98_15885, partial [bacterium]
PSPTGEGIEGKGLRGGAFKVPIYKLEKKVLQLPVGFAILYNLVNHVNHVKINKVLKNIIMESNK